MLYSIFFRIDQNGLIKFNSIECARTYAEISQNMTYKQANDALAKKEGLNQFEGGLQTIYKLLMQRKKLRQKDIFENESPANLLIE